MKNTVVRILVFIIISTPNISRAYPISKGDLLVRDTAALAVGNIIPESLWNSELCVFNTHTQSTQMTRLEAYKGKIIVLDFWATWCGSCIASLPKLHKLQQEYKHDVVILPITYQDEAAVSSFFNRGTSSYVEDIKNDFTSVINDKILGKNFPHKTIPHVVVIDKEGAIVGYTYPEYVDSENLAKLIDGSQATYLAFKQEGHLTHPILNAGSSKNKVNGPIYYSALTGFIDGFDGHSDFNQDSVHRSIRLYAKNRTVLQLYLQSHVPRDFNFGFVNRRIIISNKPWKYDYIDSAGQDRVFDLAWKRKNTYCYEAIFPLHVGKAHVYRRMTKDVDSFLGLTTKIEKRKVKVWRIRQHPHQSENQRNRQINVPNLAYTLNSRKKNPVPFTIDESGTSGEQAFDIHDERLDIDDINQLLKGSGLYVEEEESELDMFILIDREANSSDKLEELVLTPFGYTTRPL